MPIGLNDVLALGPEIVIVLSACALLLVDFIVPREKKSAIGWLSILAIIGAAVASCYLARAGMAGTATGGTLVFNNMFVVDNFSFFFKSLLFIATALSILLSFKYVKAEDIKLGEYYVLMLFSLSGMMVMVSGTDLLSIYLGVEMMSLPVYVLVALKRDSIKSNEGAMKYVILGAFSSAMMLFGISLFYGLTGTTELSAMSISLADTSANGAVIGIAIVLLVAGFGFKVAGFPFHMWAPDAYEGAPTPITAFMSVGPKAAAFAVILRIFLDGLAPLYDQWHLIFSIVAVLTLAIGNIVAIAQTNIKRMLAYSSIGHAGYVLLGVIAGGTEGMASVMFYLFVYLFMNLGIFGIIITMRGKEGLGESIWDYTGLAKKNATLAFLMLIFLFSLAGIPPTAGFIGKFYIFMSLIHQGYFALAITAVILSAVAAYFYIRIVMLMYMKEPEGEFNLMRSNAVLVVICLAAVVCIVLGIFPGLALEVVNMSTLPL
jgi:NADH-quinone oxidoreductase subunit N